MTANEDFVLPNMAEDEDRFVFLHKNIAINTSISLVSWSLIRKASPLVIKWRNNFVRFRDDE